MTRKIRKNSTEIFLVGPFTKPSGTEVLTSVALAGADKAVVYVHDTSTPVDITSNTWKTASTDGYFHLTLTSAITSVPGPCVITIQASGVYLPVKEEYEVLGSAPFDALYSSAPNILESFDINMLYKSTISSTDGLLRMEMTDGIATNNNWLGMAATIRDLSTGDSHPTYVASVSATNNLLVLKATAPFTPVAGDEVRVFGYQDPRYAIDQYDPCSSAEGVNVTRFAGVTVIGSGSADSLFRTAGT